MKTNLLSEVIFVVKVDMTSEEVINVVNSVGAIVVRIDVTIVTLKGGFSS